MLNIFCQKILTFVCLFVLINTAQTKYNRSRTKPAKAANKQSTKNKNKSSGAKRWKCAHPGCSKDYAEQRDMKKHFERKHTDFKCIQWPFQGCNQLFNSKRSMKRHLVVHFANRKRFACLHKGCDRDFVTECGVRTHLKPHQPDNDSICKHCDKQLSSPRIKYEGTQHFFRIHADPAKPFKPFFLDFLTVLANNVFVYTSFDEGEHYKIGAMNECLRCVLIYFNSDGSSSIFPRFVDKNKKVKWGNNLNQNMLHRRGLLNETLKSTEYKRMESAFFGVLDEAKAVNEETYRPGIVCRYHWDYSPKRTETLSAKMERLIDANDWIDRNCVASTDRLLHIDEFELHISGDTALDILSGSRIRYNAKRTAKRLQSSEILSIPMRGNVFEMDRIIQ